MALNISDRKEEAEKKEAVVDKLASGKSVPVNMYAPYAHQENEKLLCTMGQWEEVEGEDLSYKYTWTVGSSKYTSASAEYFFLPEDVGKTISCAVTATNASGSTESPPSNAVTVAAYSKEEAATNYFLNTLGNVYKAEAPLSMSDSRIPFVAANVDMLLHKDAAGEPIDPADYPTYEASDLTVASEALKYDRRFNSVELSKAIQNTDRRNKAVAASVPVPSTTGSTGVQNTTVAAASGNVRVSPSHR